MKAYGEEVTVSRIVEAFKKHDIQPLFGKWWQKFKHGSGCCPMSVLIVDNHGDTQFPQKIQRKQPDIAITCIASEIGSSFKAVSSFVAGFDNLCAFTDQPPPADKEAYELGVAVREALCER
jgi:hypothetical protein